MKWLRRLFRRFVPHGVSDEAMDRELGYHIAELARSYSADGLTPDEAHRRALLEFGYPRVDRGIENLGAD